MANLQFSGSRSESDQETHEDVVCLGCGCLCDDIRVTARGGRIEQAEHACELGRSWFSQAESIDATCQAWIEGRPAALAEAVRRAAEILLAARYPLICGLAGLSCEAQGKGAAIADRIGGVVDATSASDTGAALLAMQQVGQVTCTLGELRQRADTIVFWGCDPATTHPRHFERYSLDAPGKFLTGPRTCFVVDHEATATTRRADCWLQITAGRDFESLTVLRALTMGLSLDADDVLRQTGVPLAQWRRMADALGQSRYGAIVFGQRLTGGDAGAIGCEALFAWVRELNAHTRCVCLGLRGAGNSAGVENVLAWRTGYPLAVDCSRGFPRFGPGEFQTAPVLARGEADTALVADARLLDELPEASLARLKEIPFVLLCEQPEPAIRSAAVAIRVSIAGLHNGGTAYRMDDVPLPLRPPVASSLPSAADVLAAIEQLVQAGAM